MIDISQIINLGKEQYKTILAKTENADKEKVFEGVYTAMLESFLELLVTEFFKDFKENIKGFTTLFGRSFDQEIQGAAEIANEITAEYIITKENFEDNLSRLRFLQKDKNSFLEFIRNMRNDLTADKIDQFIAFYSLTNEKASIRTCCKVSNWIEMIGLIEVIKSRVLMQYQGGMTETKG